jgi:hypothetical protein
VSGCDRVEDLLNAIKEFRSEKEFELFWTETLEKCDDLCIETPAEKRQRKIPIRLDDHPETSVRLNAKDKFRVGFYFSVSICILKQLEVL